jgi:hypothetical protein
MGFGDLVFLAADADGKATALQMSRMWGMLLCKRVMRKASGKADNGVNMKSARLTQLHFLENADARTPIAAFPGQP